MVDEAGRTLYTYDGLGQVLSEARPWFYDSVSNYTYDNSGQLKSAIGHEPSGGASRLQEQLGYAYDAAGNLNWRTNNALYEHFTVNPANELSNSVPSGTLTVADATTALATNVKGSVNENVLF